MGESLSKKTFITFEEMAKKSEDTWFKLSSNDWLEAFKGHAKIGTSTAFKKYNQTKVGLMESKKE